MTEGRPVPLVRTAPGRDYLSDFIEGSRWLRGDHAAARATWAEELAAADKLEPLFEFEMLLKGLVCFGNPVNHPGPPRRGQPVVSRDFKLELGIVRSIIERILATGRLLSSGKQSSLLFQRYLESVIAQDQTRIKVAKESLAQDTPEQSLALLVSSFENLLDVVAGLDQLDSVPYKQFASSIQLAQREIHRSVYFDPLAALEFRAEFDRIESPELLQVIRSIPSDPARRVAALTFLALGRLIRYIYAASGALRQDAGLGPPLAWLSVLRSDTRALVIFLRRDVSKWLASGFERLYEKLDLLGVNSRFADLEDEFAQLKSLGGLLGSLGNQLRLEQLKMYEQQLPALDAIDDPRALVGPVKKSSESMLSFLQHTVVLLAREFEPGLDGAVIFNDFVPEAVRSNRLRRDIWMFQQILRAFIDKTRGSTNAADQWSDGSSLQFVRQFVGYFRSMGYQLLRYSDYEQFDRFMDLVMKLREGDVLEVQRLPKVIAACEDFQVFLGQTFERVNQRDELVDMPFDRRDAARTLKLFLGR